VLNSPLRRPTDERICEFILELVRDNELISVLISPTVERICELIVEFMAEFISPNNLSNKSTKIRLTASKLMLGFCE